MSCVHHTGIVEGRVEGLGFHIHHMEQRLMALLNILKDFRKEANHQLISFLTYFQLYLFIYLRCSYDNKSPNKNVTEYTISISNMKVLTHLSGPSSVTALRNALCCTHSSFIIKLPPNGKCPVRN